MPYRPRYRRRYRRRRYSKPAQPWFKNANSAYKLAVRAAKDIWYLKGLVNSEMFHVDSSATLGSAQSSITHITGIAQGDTDTGRTGNSILLRNVLLRGRIIINSSATGSSRVMCALVMDKQQVGDTSPAVSDIFKSATDPMTFMNTNSTGRFKVLWRRNYTVTAAGSDHNQILINKYLTLRKHVRYNGTGSSDIQKNGLYIVFITSESVNFPAADISSRIGYHDN